MVELAGAGPQSDEPPEEGAVYNAMVKRIEPYGVVSELCRSTDESGLP